MYKPFVACYRVAFRGFYAFESKGFGFEVSRVSGQLVFIGMAGELCYYACHIVPHLLIAKLFAYYYVGSNEVAGREYHSVVCVLFLSVFRDRGLFALIAFNGIGSKEVLSIVVGGDVVFKEDVLSALIGVAL